jgi:hypothetical protein
VLEKFVLLMFEEIMAALMESLNLNMPMTCEKLLQTLMGPDSVEKLLP